MCWRNIMMVERIFPLARAYKRGYGWGAQGNLHTISMKVSTMKNALILAAAAAMLAACAPASLTSRYDTCPFAGMRAAGVDKQECRAIENIHNIKKGGAKKGPHMVMIHGQPHYYGCGNGGQHGHTHGGMTYYRPCN